MSSDSISAASITAYRAATSCVAFFPDLGRAVLSLRGRGARRVLQGIFSNDVSVIDDERAVYGFFLDRKGRVVADARLVAPLASGRPTEGADEEIWIDVARSAVTALESHLAKYVPPIFATWRELPVRVATLMGPQRVALLRDLLGGEQSLPEEPLAVVSASALNAKGKHPNPLIVNREWIEGSGYDIYGPATDDEWFQRIQAAVTSEGGTIGTTTAWQALRVERGFPMLGAELGPGRLAQEAGQDDRAISFSKGCFTGQEVVARVHYRGRVNRLLRGLQPAEPDTAPPLNTEELARALVFPAPESEHRQRPVGEITSVAHHPLLGPIAIGYVRREFAAGSVLQLKKEVSPDQLRSRLVRVVELPFTLP